MGEHSPARDLRPEERALLEGGLASPHAGDGGFRGGLLAELAGARVGFTCDCRCGTFELAYPGTPRLPKGAAVPLAEGLYLEGSRSFRVVLHALEGRVTCLEVVPSDDRPPTAFPVPGRVKWGPPGTPG